MAPSRSRRTTALDALRGLLAAATGIGVGHLVAALLEPPASPVLAVGSQVIDLTPTPVKEWAVAQFGTADKPILIGSVLVVTLLLAALAGVIHRRRPLLGAGLLVVLCLLAAAAAAIRPSAGLLAPLPSLVAAVLGVGTIRFFHRGVDESHPSAAEPSRRRVLALGGAGAVAAAAGGGGQALIARATSPEITLPTPATALGALPKGVEGVYSGITPFVTANRDFYRIDTALTVPRVDPSGWSLTIDGDVERPVEISFDELLAMPMIEKDITMTCVSNEVGGGYIGSARWLGVPVRTLLEQAGVGAGADQVLSTSTDGMTISTPIQALTDDRDALVAVGMNGEALPAEHGFPVRLVTPGLYGFVGSTKWLTRLTVTTYAEQEAYWTERDWATDAPVRTQSRIDTPKPLARIPAGKTVIGGIAWAQGRGIDRVEVRVDGGPWRKATLGPDANIVYWRQWYLPWEATTGRHDLEVRAVDGDGQVQTEADATPFPSGATGWHQVAVFVQ